jgi:NAD(P)-dependent dehydrogenase (short-subunit alcohol dehydrogenase family)
VGHEGKIAAVTGGNKGIGLEICRQLGRLGVDVILTARDEAKGKKAREDLREEGVLVRFHPLDVGDPESIRRFREFMEKEFGRMAILVNNAGVNIDADKTGEEVDIETVSRTVRTNVYGPLLMCQAFLPLMRRQGDEHPGEFDVSRVGPHGHGRAGGGTVRRGGGRYGDLACDSSRRRPHRMVLPRPEKDPLVGEGSSPFINGSPRTGGIVLYSGIQGKTKQSGQLP